MKFTSVAAATLLAASASAQDVACRVNGRQSSVVDLETGTCSFEIPSELPVVFDFNAIDDYTVDAYYILKSLKYWNDIANAGRTIDVPAKELFNTGDISFYHVHDSETPSSNSTASLKKRFHSKIMTKRDEISDLVAHIKSLSGTELPAFTVEVSEPDVESSSASGSGSATTSAASGADVTVTDSHTTLITITSCSDNKCSETAVPATKGPTTATIDGEETVYTTWCPLTGADVTVTEKETTIITVTSCSEDKCHVTAVPATKGATTATVGGEETVYTTWCPLASEDVSTTTVKGTTVITVTSCSEDKCVETEVPAVEGPTTIVSKGETIIYTTLYPVGSTTTAAPGSVATGTTVVPVVSASKSTVAAESVTPAVSSLINGAGKMGASVLAVVALPLAYLL